MFMYHKLYILLELKVLVIFFKVQKVVMQQLEKYIVVKSQYIETCYSDSTD